MAVCRPYRRLLVRLALHAALAAVSCGTLHAQAAVRRVHGLPFTRSYSFQEIGNVSRGARLAFDAFGRVAVVQLGANFVLNDTTWVNVAAADPEAPAVQTITLAPSGTVLFGAHGAWGTLETLASGKLAPRALDASRAPAWVALNNFAQILALEEGALFAGFEGAVFWNPRDGQQTFFALEGIARVFTVGGRIFAGSLTHGLHVLDPATGTVERVPGADFASLQLDKSTRFDATRVLLTTIDGHFFLFDGHRLEPWKVGAGRWERSRVTALLQLVDGRFAAGVEGRGLYFLSPTGEIQYALTTPEYHRVTDIANREAGVLWIATESGVERILYDSPLSSFGQRLGLPASWPQVVQWRDRFVVASGGRVYESIPPNPGEPTRFELLRELPPGIWGLAAVDSHLLVATTETILSRDEDKGFTTVLEGFEAARLALIGKDVCLAIGPREIAALRWNGARWEDTGQRAPGVGYPAVVQSSRHAVWIELGANRVARVTWRDGALQVRVFDSFPWTGSRWINVGLIGDLAVLAAAPFGRLFFDELSETFVSAPALDAVFDRAPHPIARLAEDLHGTLWASYEEGVMMIPREEDGYRVDADAVATVDGRHPIVQVAPSGDVWLGTGHSLYHIDRPLGASGPSAQKPLLVSVTAGHDGREISRDPSIRLPYADNSLTFQFFTGSYDWRHPPAYEFILHRGDVRRVVRGNGSLLTLTDLREGAYRLEARLSDGQAGEATSVSVPFFIVPPWYRTTLAYAGYATLVAALVAALMALSARRSRAQNRILERLVAERTEALQAAMTQLGEEARTSATIAERNRLAAEIHDSLQQGLSGLMLHLDSTLQLKHLPGDLRDRLSVARNMVSFTRHEVQHAVWDMETPLLEDTELGDALRKLAEFISSGSAPVHVGVSGEAVVLTPSAKHHLLRIAQEALTNAVRHAAASAITIMLEYRSDAVQLAVVDDGRGFTPTASLSTGLGHFGLRGLQARARKLGATLDVCSAPGEGTRITVTLPLPAAESYSHAV